MSKSKKCKSGHIDYGLAADVCVRTLHQLVRRDLDGNDIFLNPQCHSYIRRAQDEACLKKYVFLNNNQGLDKKAYSKFLDVNARLKKFVTPKLPTRVSRYNTDQENILLLAKRYIDLILGDVSWEEVFLQARHSGGASLGVSYADTSMEKKFSYPMTSTESASRLFDMYLTFDHRLKVALDNSSCNMEKIHRYDIVDSSRATTVPKSSEIDRMIAVEPTVNMYLQQGIMHLMYARLKAVGLDVTTLPDRHKILAREASITGRMSTIDFSSASDCVSISLLEEILPKKWFRTIMDVRCSHMSVDGENIELSMISTMGNATTFPLETLVFYSLGVACVHYLGNKHECGYFPYLERFGNSVSVFGDDCILPTEATSLFIEICHSVGFIVNIDKSFFGPPGFRESCGGDYLHGTDVRPFFFKRPHSRSKSAYVAWLYTIFNEVRKKYILYFGPNKYVYAKHALRYLLGKLHLVHKFLYVVPCDFPSDSGILGYDLDRLSRNYFCRYNRIKIDEHGTHRFNYIRFQYWKHVAVNDDLRYFNTLKRLSPTWRERSLFYHIRQRGGYVVAKASTAHWAWS